MTRRLITLGLLALQLALALAPAAPIARAAGGWSLSNVLTNNTSGFESLQYAVIGDDGTIAVQGVRNGKEGIYRITGGITAIAEQGLALPGNLGTVELLNTAAVDPQGRVLFTARVSGGSLPASTSLRVFRWSAGAVTHMLPDDGSTHYISHLNSQGSWMTERLIGTFASGTREFRQTNGLTTTLLHSAPQSSAGCREIRTLANGALNAAGQALFFARDHQALAGPGFCDPNNVTESWTLHRTGTAPANMTTGSYSVVPFTASGSMIGTFGTNYRINDAGVAAYVREDGSVDDTNPVFPRHRLFVRDAIGEQVLADTDASALKSIYLAGFNHVGQVTFAASLDDGDSAVYAGPNLTSDLVLRTGDQLFGQELVGLSLHSVNSPPATFGDTRALLFSYTLADGTEGIGLASKSSTRWVNPSGGSWGTAVNWSPAEVPGQGDTTTFDLEATYDVNVGTRQTGRSSVQNGSVSFRGADLTMLGPLAVGGDATLTVPEGTVRTDDLIVGSLPPTDPVQPPTAHLFLSNAGTLVTSSARTQIGDAGKGELLISGARLESAEVLIGGVSQGNAIVGANGTWVNTDIAVGSNVTGTLEIEHGGEIRTSGDAVIGQGATLQNHIASVTIDNTGSPLPALGSWSVADTFTIGNNLPGELVIRGGGLVAAFGIFQSALKAHPQRGSGFDALIEVRGVGQGNTPSSLTAFADMLLGMGNATRTALSVKDGARVEGFQNLTLAHEQGSLVTATVAGVHSGGQRSTLRVGTIQATEVCVIGRAGEGSLFVLDGALLECPVVLVGQDSGSDGALIIGGTMANQTATARITTLCVGGSVLCSGSNDAPGTLNFRGGVAEVSTLAVGQHGRVSGTGSIQIDSTDMMFVHGTLDPGVNVEPGIAPIQPTRQAAPIQPGTLTITGSLTLEPTAVLTFDLTGAGKLDKLVVDGALVRGGTLALQFSEGYAPRAGDVFTFVEAGSASGSFASVTISGLAPGFQFEVSTSGATTTLTALNDGVPTTSATPNLIYLPLVQN